MATLPKGIYRFNKIPPRIPMTCFTGIGKAILKFMWKHKIPKMTKAILSKNSNAKDTTVSDFKLYCRAIITKKAWHWNKNRHVHQ
jgi:hypothetical protein